MSDIAEQLHKMADDMIGPYRRLTLEAANEVERLRAIKTPASQELLNITKGCLDDAEAEVGRLRTALTEITALPPVDGEYENDRRQQELRLNEQARTIARRALEGNYRP